MKYTIVLALYVSLCKVCYTSAEMEPQNAVSRSNWEITSSIYTKISQAANPESNIIFSPICVQVILALCSMGAGGENAKQMLKILDLHDSTDDIKIGFKRLLESLPSSGKVNLEIANLIFPAVQYNILNTFNVTAQEFFSSNVANINYKDSTNAARTINELVKQKTHKKITDVISEDGLDANTAMVLINAVYFKGVWDVAVDIEDKTLGMFYVNRKVRKEIMMMQGKRKFNIDINTELGAKLLEVPYMNNTMTFFIILPLENDGLPSVEAKLATMEFMDVYESSKQYVDVHLSFPIFSINQSLQFNKILQELEIVDMFGNDADFSGMSPEMGLSVSKVLHKAMIEFNEEGTVATAEVQPAAGLSPQGERFVVDHPFIFALVSKLTNVVVLMGRYTGDGGETKFTYNSSKDVHNSPANKKITSMASGDKDFTGHRVRREIVDLPIDEGKEKCGDLSTYEDAKEEDHKLCKAYFIYKGKCKHKSFYENNVEGCKAISSSVYLKSSWRIIMALSIIDVFQVL